MHLRNVKRLKSLKTGLDMSSDCRPFIIAQGRGDRPIALPLDLPLSCNLRRQTVEFILLFFWHKKKLIKFSLLIYRGVIRDHVIKRCKKIFK